MTTRDANWPEGTPCWVDLAVDDCEKAQAFYSRLFGWEIERGPEHLHGYTRCTTDGRAVAGLSSKVDPEQPSFWNTHLASDDLDATVAKLRRAGGQVLLEPSDVPGMGRTALAVDPGGAFLGLWEGGAHHGFGLTDEPGSVTWSENISRDWRRNGAFYAAVVGWELEELPGGMEYATFKVQGQLAGGIGAMTADLPDDVPAHWNTYFKVADADRAVARVRELGGTVGEGPWDSEFGRMAAVTDDQGVRFTVMADVR